MSLKKYLFFTDLHLSFISRVNLVNIIKYHNPAGVMITGDFTDWSLTFSTHLEYIAKNVKVPIYFVLGNHEIWFSSFEKIAKELNTICEKYPHLIYLSQQNPLSLNHKTGIIGECGWYCGSIGNIEHLKYTLDWIFIKDFRELPNMEARLAKFKEIAERDTNIICDKLRIAFETYKKVYLLTHFPPFKEANKYAGSFSEGFWEPYNSNIIMGQKLKALMKEYKKKRLIILAGHSHTNIIANIKKNIQCNVGAAFADNCAFEIIYI